MLKFTVIIFYLVARFFQPTHGQGICDLPDSGTVELTGSCNFNKGVCGYDFPSTLWYVHTESFGGLIYGKIRGDEESEKQTFALFQSNDPKVNESLIVNSSIVSPVIYTSPVCLKFWFLMPNQNSKLYVYTVDQRSNLSNLVYSYVYKPASQWKEAKVQINPGSAYKLEFRSAKENSYGYVGIDHIQVLIALTTTGASTATTTTPPTTTITTTTPTTTTTTTPTTTSTTTSTTTTTSPTTTSTTTSTTTTTSPTTTSTTTSATTTTTTSTTMTTTTTLLTTSTTVPTTTTKTTPSSPSTSCTCNCPSVPTICAGASLPTTTPVPPPTVCDLPDDQRSVLDQYSCNFDHGLCGFDVSDYPHLWEYTSNRYGDPDVGEIIGDHSPEALGGYVVFNTYNNHVQNGTEHVLKSPPLRPFTKYCVSFWFNMPNNESQLQVYAEFDNGSRLLLWERSGAESNGWERVKVAVGETYSFRLQFRSWKVSDLSFLAVDDVQVSIENSLFPRSFRSNRQSELGNEEADDSSGCACTCPPYHVIDCDKFTPVPPYVKSCEDLTGAVLESNGSCDFDNGNACKYIIPVYPHLWELVRFRYGNESVGVIYGDTSNENAGLYAAFTTDSYRVPLGEVGEMTSSPVLYAGQLCLSFWYNMPTDASTMNVYKESGSRRSLLWSKSHVTSGGWQRETIILSANETFQLVFSSTKANLGGYFGIDDIRLYSHVGISA